MAELQIVALAQSRIAAAPQIAGKLVPRSNCPKRSAIKPRANVGFGLSCHICNVIVFEGPVGAVGEGADAAFFAKTRTVGKVYFFLVESRRPCC